MTDKTERDALVAQLDDYLRGCPDPNKVRPKWLIKKASRLLWACREALAEQPAGKQHDPHPECPQSRAWDQPEQPAGAVGDDKWVLIEQCVICHGSGYKSGVNGPRPCLNCDGEGSRSPSPAASVDVKGVQALTREIEEYASGWDEGDATRVRLDRWSHEIKRLIDSAGGAKGGNPKRCTECPGSTFETRHDGSFICVNCKTIYRTPQPDGGNGAVFGYVYQLADEEPSFEFAANRWPSRGGNHTETAVYARPSAAAAVPEVERRYIERAIRVLRRDYESPLADAVESIYKQSLAAAPAASTDISRYEVFKTWWFDYWTKANYEDDVSKAKTPEELDHAIDKLIGSAGGAKCECNLVRTCRVCKENAERFNA